MFNSKVDAIVINKVTNVLYVNVGVLKGGQLSKGVIITEDDGKGIVHDITKVYDEKIEYLGELLINVMQEYFGSTRCVIKDMSCNDAEQQRGILQFGEDKILKLVNLKKSNIDAEYGYIDILFDCRYRGRLKLILKVF